MTYSERFGDIAIVELDTNGFEHLTHPQKKLAFYLSEAGLWGKRIALEQNSRYNIPFINALINIYNKADADSFAKKDVKDILFVLFTHGGIYHTTSGEKLDLPFNEKLMDTLKNISLNDYNCIKNIINNKEIPKFRTVQKAGVDVVKESGMNFYQGLTTEEVEAYRKENYPESMGDEIPPYGFNERLVKNQDGDVVAQTICVDGLYGKYVAQIIKNLRKALDFTESKEQYDSINTLIQCYETGSAEDFDKHCIAWVKDKESPLYFINGLIESYKDPLGVGCNFESLVAFKNPQQTAKVEKIIEHIQYFEDNLPVAPRFKKDKASGLSASSVNVISMAGETSPVLPLGINLPNSDWIRKVHGSKSVTLSNVDSSRNTYDIPLKKALYLPEYQGVIDKYGNETGVLHTDLHEIAGHGSCKVMEGVSADDLSTYYSVIEECRADLVALYYVADPKLKEIGVFDKDVNVEEAALAKYVHYLTNGAIGQLRRVKLGNDLTQAHFRNRQIISTWVLEHASKDKVSLVEDNGSYYIKVDDVSYTKELFGNLLSEVQRIKSEGDFEAAKHLVETYGTKVNQDIHKEILERISKLDLASVTGFLTPELKENGNTVIIVQPESFMEQQLRFYKVYCS